MSKFLQIIEEFDPSTEQNPIEIAYDFADLLKTNNIKFGKVKGRNTFYIHDTQNPDKVFVVEVSNMSVSKPSEEDGEAETVIDTLANVDTKAFKAKADRLKVVKTLGGKVLPKYVQQTNDLRNYKI